LERKIVRHAVGGAAHDAALDTDFHQGQRVVTIDGYAGRIVFVSNSFSPGVTEYQVTLDNGMGGGTYIGSQLRAVPDSYRAPAGPVSHLPAGVTAVLEAEAGEIHLASDDYPEMGQILHDRPDPAGQFQVIGSRHKADAYTRGYDARDDDENGGEADTGIYWETPANQEWRDDNLGEPPEPTIEDDTPGFGPEQFEQQFGKISTTINGQAIDGHGDAPDHGTRPRAAEANAYDDESTEGQGDPDEDKPLDGTNEDAERASTTGMFPAGVFAGDGFGSMGFGAARVPWTGAERTELHNWNNGQGAPDGDFVPHTNFTDSQRPTRQELDELAPDVIAQQLQAQGVRSDVFCAYRHEGPCRFPPAQLAAHGEHMRHSRPRDFHSEIHPVDQDTQSDAMQMAGLTPTHVIKGYLGGRHVGSLHFQQSDDGRAAYVTNLESHAHGKGVASGMMDDLYSHAHRNGMWINHGQRTDDGLRWWNSYHEPHPEHNVHETWPDEGLPANHAHPAMRPWREYWSPHEVAADMHINAEYDREGGHSQPQYDHLHYEDDPHYERWKNSIKQVPEENDPNADEAMRDAKRDMHDDPYHGWGELAHTGSAHNPDHHYELHLINDHGYSPADIDRIRNHGLHDMHGTLHQMGLPNHQHADLPGELAAGWRQHEQEQTADRFGLRPTRQYLRSQTGPQRGGSAGHFPDETRDTNPQLPDDPAKLNAFWSSRQAEAASIRVRQHGDNDYEFTFGKDEAQDPANSLDEGEPEGGQEPEAEDEANSLEHGEPGENAGEQSGTPENASEQPETDQDTSGAVGSEPPGNLPAGVTPPKTPSKRAPLVPQSGGGTPESWPLATAPIQEGLLPLSEGRQPSPTTRRNVGNPVKLQLPGAGDGAEVDGEKPGADEDGGDKPPAKEAALAAFTAAAASESFRFEFTAAWRDVVAKSKRLRTAGRVRITHVSSGMVIGAVGGDHDVYECGIQRPPHRPQGIQHWACGCPWASFHQDSSYPGRLNGRPCSHVYALHLEAASRSAHGRELTADPGAEELGLTHQVVVKSMPPWGPGGWNQTWLAPSASLAKTAEMFCPACGDDRDDSGRCYGCGTVSRDLRQDSYLHGAVNVPPSVLAARQLVAAGEDPGDVAMLARVAGIDLTAAANDPWGDNNLTSTEMPPAKPYGATEPPNKAMDPGSYGPLAGPDPQDWGDIELDGLGQPFSHEAVLPGLEDGEAVADTPDDAIPYAARTNTAGPATPLDARDPNGIRMEEARDPQAEGAEYEQHLIDHHGVHPDDATRWDYHKHVRDHEDAVKAREIGEPPETHWDGWHSHPYHEMAWEQRNIGSGQWPDAGGSHSFVAAEHRELPDNDPLGEHHHHPECTCPTCDYNRYHAKHAVQIALQAGLAELEAGAVQDAERARLRIGVDGTPGDAQDAPHEFHGNTPYCQVCQLSPDAGVHHRDGASGELHDRPEPALPEATGGLTMPDVPVAGGDPLAGATTGGGPGMSSDDESLSPDDTSIQTVGAENFGGDDEIADEGFSTGPQENYAEAYSDDPVSQFQATAAARQYAGGDGQPTGDGEIAAAARAFLSKTADVLPDHEAAALISEGRGQRARNLDMLQLEGTHYEGIDEEMAHRGLDLDHYDDDLVVL
jgi:hypothetical protein